MRIIALNGARNTGKDYIAKILSKDEYTEFILPYTDKKAYLGVDPERTGGYHYLKKDVLDEKIGKELVLSLTTVKDYRYVYFKSQLINGDNVLILDDNAITHLKQEYSSDELLTIRLKSKNSKPSDRFDCYLYDHEFDIVYDKSESNINELLRMVG